MIERSITHTGHANSGQATGVGGDVVEKPLNEDDADTDMFCNVGQKFVKDVVDWIESVTEENALCGRSAVGLNTRHVEVAELGVDGVLQQSAIVGHGAAVIVAEMTVREME